MLFQTPVSECGRKVFSANLQAACGIGLPLNGFLTPMLQSIALLLCLDHAAQGTQSDNSAETNTVGADTASTADDASQVQVSHVIFQKPACPSST